MNKLFNLEWHELPEELREQKIGEYLTRMWYEDPSKKEEYEDYDDYAKTEWMDAEASIQARFPMYF